MANRSQVIDNLAIASDAIGVIAGGLGGPAQTILQRIVSPALQLTRVWLENAPASAEEYARLWDATQRLVDAADALMEAAAAKPPEGAA